MGRLVSLKGNKYGITVFVTPSASFEEARAEAGELFASSKMFSNQKIAVGFEGKLLSDFEKEELTKTIAAAGNFKCICIMDFSLGTEERFKAAVERSLEAEEEERRKSIMDSAVVKKYQEDVDKLLAEITSLRSKVAERDEKLSELSASLSESGPADISNIAKFYKGNLRSGFVLEDESSLVIVGDVNAGSEVVSGGNIIILGTLRGSARAGAKGNTEAFVFALNMQPMQVSIADVVARAGDNTSKKESHEPSIAIIRNDSIAIELATKTVLNDINI